MEKMYFSELIKAYKNEIEKVITKYNGAISRANKAHARGDAHNYRRNMSQAHDCETELERLNTALQVIRTEFAAV